MSLHFLLDDSQSDARVADIMPGETVALTGAEAHHAAAVRRVRVGESVTVGDGHGLWLAGLIEAVSPREVAVRVTSRTDVPANETRIVLAQALAKGDRDELAVQAATELGIDEIIPWQAARSVSRWDAAKAEKGRARWSAIVREAAKQAHRAWIPSVAALASTGELAERAEHSRVIVLEPSATTGLTDLLRAGPRPRDLLLVVGPEGGISPDELALLERAGASSARLGDTVLRTSTAGPAAVAVASAALRRW